jgi:hypothetical protein
MDKNIFLYSFTFFLYFVPVQRLVIVKPVQKFYNWSLHRLLGLAMTRFHSGFYKYDIIIAYLASAIIWDVSP